MTAGCDGLPMPRRLLAITAISFGTALSVIDGAIANVALPTIARDLGTDRSSAVLVATIYQLVLVMALLPLSALGQQIGLKRMYQGGQTLFAVATLLCFFSNSLPFLLVVRAFQALGAAAAMSVATALLRQIYPAKHLGRGLGVHSIVITVSASIAPTLGGGVLAIAPWPWVFASAIPFALLSLAFGRALPEVEQRQEKYDLAAAAMCAAMFGFVIAGLESGMQGDSPMVSAFVILIGVSIGFVFVRRELGQAEPIMPVDLLGRPVIALSAIGALTAFIGQMLLFVSLPFRLEQDFGLSPAEVGAVIAPWPMVMIFVAPAAGFLSDRYPAGLLGGIGMAISVIALLALAWPPPDASYFDLAWRMALCGAGFGLFQAPNVRLLISSAPRHRSAAAGGLVPTVRLTGQTLGATCASALLAIGAADGKLPALVAAGLCLVAGLTSIARLRPRPEHDDAIVAAYP